MNALELPHLSQLPLVILSTQSWSDMWVSKHWLASEISRVTPVVFINPIEYCVTRSDLPLRNLLEPRIEPISRTLYSVRLLGLPYHSNLRIPSGLITQPLAMRQLRRAFECLEISRFNLLNFDPKSLYYARGLRPQAHVHYSVDPVYGRENPVYTEQRLLQSCDRVIAVTDLLKSALLAKAPNALIDVIPHGLNANEIADQQDWERPADLPNSKVIVGYTGSIHEACVDMDLVRRAAIQHPDWAFVFVGSYQRTALAQAAGSVRRLELPNIHLLGPRPFHALKNYIHYFDACIAPYDLTRNQSWDRRSPFKLLHYLAQGKPVVVPTLGSLADVHELTYQYPTKDRFQCKLEEAVQGAGDAEARDARIAFARTRDFSVALRKIDHIFGQVQASKPADPIESLSAGRRHLPYWEAPDCPCCGGRPIADARATKFLQLEAPDVVWRCLRCDLRYRGALPQLLPSERDATMRRKGLAFSGYAGGTERVSAHLRRRLRFLGRRFCDGGRRLLDVGCGTGSFLREARRSGWDAYGVELVDTHSNPRGEPPRVFQADPARAPLPPESPRRFDVIHLNHVLEHVDEPQQILKQLRDYLAPAGWMVVEVPNELEGLPASIKQRQGRPSSSATSYFQHRLFFSPRSLRRVLEASGLRVLRLYTPDQVPRQLSPRGILGSVSAALHRGSAIEVVCGRME